MKRRRKRGQGESCESRVGVQTFCPACRSFTTFPIRFLDLYFKELRSIHWKLMESSGRSRLNGRMKDCVELSPARMFRVMYTLSDDYM